MAMHVASWYLKRNAGSNPTFSKNESAFSIEYICFVLATFSYVCSTSFGTSL